jgi:ABC-type maltose transport system permease subunit
MNLMEYLGSRTNFFGGSSGVQILIILLFVFGLLFMVALFYCFKKYLREDRLNEQENDSMSV